MIENIETFVDKFKKVADRSIQLYIGDEAEPINFTELDFDVNKLRQQMSKVNNKALLSVLKKAYQFIRAYHRSFRVYKMSREDYFNYAVWDVDRDKRIADKILTKLKNLEVKLTESFGVEIGE